MSSRACRSWCFRHAEKKPIRCAPSTAGANDYVTKPFREAELFARLRAALKSVARAARHAETLTIGPLRIQRFERRVFMDKVEIELTPTEFSLLHVLARDAGRVITHRQLLAKFGARLTSTRSSTCACS